MNEFLFNAGLLLVVALALVLPRLLRSRALGLAVLLTLIVPAATVLIYRQIGTPEALNPAARSAPDQAASEQAVLAQLEAQVKNHPGDQQAWFLLGRLHSGRQDFASAAIAFESAAELDPDNPLVITELAAALLLNAGPQQAPPNRAVELIERALSMDSNQQKALWLRGMLAFREGNFQASLNDWERLAQLVSPDSPIAASLSEQIDQAKQRLQANEVATHLVQVNVALASGAVVQAHDTLFVFIRRTSGGAPVAVRRVARPEFPLTLQLSDADSMQSGNALSNATGELEVVARLSASGTATERTGDRYGSATIEPQQAMADIVIDRVAGSD